MRTASFADVGWHFHADVLALCVALAGGYVLALRRVGPSHVHPIERAASRRQIALFMSGVATIWIAAGTPVHDLAERYLLSVHMTQHMLLTLVAPPLLVLGTPAWLVRVLLRPRGALAIARIVTRPLPALLAFNAVIAISHWAVIVDATLRSHVLHFVLHAVLFATATAMWMPIVSPVMELPRLAYPVQMLYLFVQSLVPTVPASFLTLGSRPLYRFYELAPRMWGLDAMTDQRIGGLVMKVVAGFILWGVIAGLFFKWFAREHKEGVDVLKWQDVERDLRRAAMPARAVDAQ